MIQAGIFLRVWLVSHWVHFEEHYLNGARNVVSSKQWQKLTRQLRQHNYACFHHVDQKTGLVKLIHKARSGDMNLQTSRELCRLNVFFKFHNFFVGPFLIACVFAKRVGKTFLPLLSWTRRQLFFLVEFVFNPATTVSSSPHGSTALKSLKRPTESKLGSGFHGRRDGEMSVSFWRSNWSKRRRGSLAWRRCRFCCCFAVFHDYFYSLKLKTRMTENKQMPKKMSLSANLLAILVHQPLTRMTCVILWKSR